MRAFHLVGSLFLFSIFTACSQSSDAKLTKDIQTVVSWAATARMTADAWSQGSVPTAYAEQTLQKAQQELQKEMSTFAQRPHLSRQLEQIEQATEQLSIAIQHHDRFAVISPIQQLLSAQQQLDALAKS